MFSISENAERIRALPAILTASSRHRVDEAVDPASHLTAPVGQLAIQFGFVEKAVLLQNHITRPVNRHLPAAQRAGQRPNRDRAAPLRRAQIVALEKTPILRAV